MPKRNIFLRIAVLMLITCFATSGVIVGSGTSAKYIAGASRNASATVALFNVEIQESNDNWKRFDQNNGATMTTVALFTDFGAGNRAHIYCTDPWGEPECHVAPGFCTHDTGEACDEACENSCEIHQPCDGDCEEECEIHSPGPCKLEPEYALGDLIAPGMMGCMEFRFRNKSEVSVKFYVDTATFAGVDDADLTFRSTTDATLPTYFPVKDTINGTLGSAVSTATVTIHPNAGGAEEQTIYFWWCWPFDRGDTQDDLDTGLGELARDKAEAAVVNDDTVPCTATFLIKAVQVD